MPNPRKPAHLRAGKSGTTRDFGVVKGGKSDPPKCPDRMGGVKPLVQTVEAWDRMWSSELSGVIDARSDLAGIVRYFELLDERERAFRAYRKHRMVEGSQGQAVLSPMWQVVRSCDTELRSLEDRIGLSPKARLQLGITYAEAGRSLDELNRLMEDDTDDGDEESAAPDPRLEAIEATSRTSRRSRSS